MRPQRVLLCGLPWKDDECRNSNVGIVDVVPGMVYGAWWLASSDIHV